MAQAETEELDTSPTLSDGQIRIAAIAALEVLNGAQSSRILERLNDLIVARLVLKALAEGVVVCRTPTPPPAPALAPSQEPPAAPPAQ